MTPIQPESGPPGFSDGARSIFDGLAFVWRTPAARPFAIVPIGILTLLSASSVVVALTVVAPRVTALLPETSSFLGDLGVTIAGITAALTSMIIGVAISAWLTPLLSAPALDHLVSLRQEALGASHLEPAGFFAQLWCGVRAQALALLVGVPILGVLWLVTLTMPVLAFVTLPLKVLVVASTLAWGLLDYPLSRRGLRLGERIRLLRDGKRAALGFGAVFALLFAVPFVGIVLLPAGVVAATDLAVRLTRKAA